MRCGPQVGRAGGRRPAGVLVFVKAPVPGRVKTRLADRLGAADACSTYVALVESTLVAVARSGLPAELWIDGGGDHPAVHRWSRDHALPVYNQRGRDLGERMHHAFVDGLRRYRRCLLVGSDCATLRGDDIAGAARRLRRVDAVVGPSWDGGYVLLGLNAPAPALFERMPWSTRRVYAVTRRRARGLGLRLRVLRHQHDVDRVADLHGLGRKKGDDPLTSRKCRGAR